MLTTILMFLMGLVFGHWVFLLFTSLSKKYQIIRRHQQMLTVSEFSVISDSLNTLAVQLNHIWAVLQANGYQTDAYTGYTGQVAVAAYTGYDYSGYDYTGYASTTMDPPPGWGELPPGPVGAIGPQGERTVLGAAIPSNTPPANLLPEVDYLEEQRDI